MKRAPVGMATVIALMALGCESRRTPSATATPTVARSQDAAAGAAPDQPMTLVPTGEQMTFTPEPANAAPRDVPPDGTFRSVSIHFITSIPDLERRTSDVEGLAELITAAVQVVVAQDAARPGQLGTHAYLWIAVKPGRRVRAWLTGDEPVDPAIERPIVDAVGRLRGPETRGMVVLMLPLARREESPREDYPPGPPSWQAAAQDGDTVEQAVARAWAGDGVNFDNFAPRPSR